MPGIHSQRFVKAFEDALARGGKLSAQDVASLQSIRASITSRGDAAAADGLLAMVSHDHELDSFEVAPASKALGVLLGVTHGRLPADLEKVLAHAVPVANVTVRQYDLTFDLSGKGPTFPAHARITLDQAAPATTVLEAHDDRLSISSVKDNRLFVDAPSAAVLDIDYTVKPTDASDPNAYGLIQDKYSGRMWTLTWPYNTGALFPSNSAPSDGVTAKVTVKIPEKTEAVGSGEGQGTSTTFEMKAQAPAYSIAFYKANRFTHGPGLCACHSVTVSSEGMENKVSPEIRAGYTRAAKDALEFYSGWLGAYDYGKTLKLVESQGGLGGMEHTGAVAIMLGAARDPEESRETAAHETAHHWFGDNIRIKSWGDFWMSEGFTNYATYRFFRHSEGEAKFTSLMDRAKGAVTAALQSNPHALSAPANTDVNEIFDSIPYEMGPWMLRMMEAQLTTPVFDALLKDWFVARRQTAVSTEDFVAFAKEKTGKDFGPFFKAWNNITAVPDLTPDVKVQGKQAVVSLKANNATPAGLTVPLRLDGKNGETMTVQVKPGAVLNISVPFVVASTSWDPERTVLANVH